MAIEEHDGTLSPRLERNAKMALATTNRRQNRHLGKSFVDVTAELSPVQRRTVKARAAKLIAEEKEKALRTLRRVRASVARFFEGDVAKTNKWFRTPNPMLGNVSPNAMIRGGRQHKLAQFVTDAMRENRAAMLQATPTVGDR